MVFGGEGADLRCACMRVRDFYYFHLVWFWFFKRENVVFGWGGLWWESGRIWRLYKLGKNILHGKWKIIKKIEFASLSSKLRHKFLSNCFYASTSLCIYFEVARAMCAQQHSCGGRKANCRSRLSPPTTRILDISSGHQVWQQHLYPLIYFASHANFFFETGFSVL